MAGVGPEDLHALALEFLAACAEALDTVPTYAPALGGAPERTFVSPGTPVFDFAGGLTNSDCDQLTVHIGNLSEGSSAPRSPRASASRINRVTLIATAARCCLPHADSNGNAPSAASQQAAAEQINADKWALWNHIYNLINGGQLFDKCCDVIWGTLSPIQPSGGCGGSVLPLTVCFDGYEEALGT